MRTARGLLARIATGLAVAALLAPVLAVAGCATSAEPAGLGGGAATSAVVGVATDVPVVPASPGPVTSSAGSRTMSVSVRGSTVTPSPSTVDLPVGQTLALTVTSDHGDEVHAHGFDIEKQVAAGGSVLLVLTGTQAGEYEVEMHDPVLILLKIAVH